MKAQDIYRQGGFEGLYLPVTLDGPGFYELIWTYEHFQIPDQFTLRLDGAVLVDTGFRPGGDTGRYMFEVKGDSAKVAAVVATNNPQTQWTFNLKIDAGLSKPIAVADKYRVGKDDTINGLAGVAKKLRVSENDFDLEGLDLASIKITTAPKRGTVKANADGTVTYNASRPGADSFFYTIEDTDGNVSKAVRVTILGDCPDPAPLTVSGFLNHDSEANVCIGRDYHLIGRVDGLDDLLRVDTTTGPTRGFVMVFEDRVEIKNARIAPLQALGAGPYPLFYGDLTLPVLPNSTAPGVVSSLLTVTSTEPAERFYLSGLWFKPTRLELRPDQLNVQGTFALPAELGGFDIELGVVNGLVFKESGLSLGGGKIAFPTETKFNLFGKLAVKATSASIEYQAVEDLLKIRGKFDLTSNLFKGDVKPTKYGEGMGITLDFLGTEIDQNFLQVKNGVADMKGSFKIGGLVADSGWGLTDFSIFMETQSGQLTQIGGAAKVILPFSRGKTAGGDAAQVAVGGEIILAFNPAKAGEWGVTKFNAFGENLNIALPPAPGFFLQNISAGIDGWAIWDPDPTSLSGSLLFTLGTTALKLKFKGEELFPQNWIAYAEQFDPAWADAIKKIDVEGNPLNINVSGRAAVDKLTGQFTLTGSGDVSIIGEAIFKLSSSIEWNYDKGSVALSGGFTGLAGIINGTAKGTLTASDQAGLSLTGKSSVVIPKAPGLGKWAGVELANANLLVNFTNNNNAADDVIAVWDKLSLFIPNLGSTIEMNLGIKATFDGGFGLPSIRPILGAKDVPIIASWDVHDGQQALVMGAEWENQVTDGVPVRVSWKNLETNEERIYEEHEFEANGIAVIHELTNDWAKTVIVAAPTAGRWDILLPDGIDFGAVTFAGFEPTPDASLSIPGAGAGDRDISFDYEVANAPPGMTLSVFWDDDADGFDGTLIASGIAVGDGLGRFEWVKQGLTDANGDGLFHIYTLLDSPGSFPVLEYHDLSFDVPGVADVAVERLDFPLSVPDGETFHYRIALKNVGDHFAERPFLSERLEGAIIEDAWIFEGNGTLSFIGGLPGRGIDIIAADGLHVGEQVVAMVRARAQQTIEFGPPDDGGGDGGDDGSGDDGSGDDGSGDDGSGDDGSGDDGSGDDGGGEVPPPIVFTQITADAYVGTLTSEDIALNNRDFDFAKYAEVAEVVTPADIKVERVFQTDVTNGVSTLRYDLVVTNQGPGTARNITLTEMLSGAAVEDYFATPLGFFGSPPVISPTSLRTTINEIGAGSQVVLPVRLRATEAGELRMQAEVTHPGEDIDRHNDFDIDLIDTKILGTEPGDVDIALRIGQVTEGANGQVLLQLDVINEGAFTNLASDIQVKLTTGPGLSITGTNARNAATEPLDTPWPTWDAGSGVWSLNGVIQGDGITRSVLVTLQKDAPEGGVFRAELISLRERDFDSTPNNGSPIEDDIVVTTIGAPNRAPTLASLIPDVTVGEGQQVNFTIPSTSFLDADGDAVRYTARGMPAWLTLDGATGRFTGEAASDQSDQAYNITVFAFDNRGGITSDTFRLAVNDVRTAPVANKPYADISALVGVPFGFQLPQNVPWDNERAYFLNGDLYRNIPGTFDDNHVSFELFDPASLPDWLTWGGGFIHGTPQADDVGTVTLTVIGRNRYYDGQELDGLHTITLTVAPVDPPVVGTPIGVLEATEEQGFTFAVPAGAFSDPQGDGLGYWWEGLPSWLTYDVVTGALSGTPTQGDVGAFTVTLHASDGNLGVASQAVTITVANVPDAPVTVSDDFGLLPGTTLSASVAGNDGDQDGDALAFSLVSGPANGTLAFDADGGFVYTPAAGFIGRDVFTYQATDGALTSVPTEVRLFVKAPPQGTADRYTVEMNFTPDGYGPSRPVQVLTVPAEAGVLENDDLGPDAVYRIAQLVEGPKHGTLSAFGADGSFAYRPDNEFRGTDSFTYRPWDGLQYGDAVTVTLDVTFVNRPAVAVGDTLNLPSDPARPDKPLTFAKSTLVANDLPRDGDTLTPVILRAPVNGTLVDNGDGTMTYTPVAGFRGTDGFLYSAHDPYGPSINPTFTTIFVGAPDAFIDVRDDVFSTAANTALTVSRPGVARNDADPDTGEVWAGTRDGLFYINVQLVDGPINGTLNFLNSDGSFRYTPNPGFTGTDTFTYRSADFNRPAGDGNANPDRATVTILVGGTDGTPAPTGQADAYASREGEVLIVDVASGLLANDSAAAGRTMVAELVQQTTYGRVVLSPYGNFRYEPSTKFDGSFNDYNGPDVFTYRIWDGSKASAPIPVTINIAPVPDLPFVQDVYEYLDPRFQSVIQYQVGIPDGTGGVSAINGEAANVGAFVEGQFGGRLFMNPNGQFQWQPNLASPLLPPLKPGEWLEETFTYTWTNEAGSATAMMYLRIFGQDDPATGIADTYGITPNTALVVDAFQGVLANDIDPDGLEATAQLIGGPANGTLAFNPSGAFVYTPRLGFVGIDTFSYRPSTASQFAAATQVTIDVQPLVTNTPPVAAPDSYAVAGAGPLVVAAAAGVLANDSDAQDDPIIAQLVQGPANGTVTLALDGSFTYAAAPGFSGVDGFTYRASDGQAASEVVAVTIAVPVNGVPLAGDGARALDEDTVLRDTLAPLATDADGDPLAFTVVLGPRHGALALQADGSFAYTPGRDFAGEDSFVYRASDGRDADSGTVTLTVRPVNDAPVASPVSYQMEEDGVLVVQPPGPLGFATDAEDEPLTLVIVNGPTLGTFTPDATGQFTYTPPQDFFGVVNFTFRASDGVLLSNVAAATITVLPQNDPPSAAADAASTPFGTPVVIDVLANDSDREGTPLTTVIRTAPENGTAVVLDDGTILYTPDAGFRGTDRFEYSAFDGINLSIIAPVVVTVEPPPNVAPIAAPDSAVLAEDTSVIIPVLANDLPGDDDPLTVTIASQGPFGFAQVLADQTIRFTPYPDNFGFTSFTYRISDGQAFSDAVVTIAITPVPDAPIAFNDWFGVLYETPTEVDPLLYDYDADGDALTFELISAPQHGTFTPVDGKWTFLYTPNAGFSGRDIGLYRVSDGELFSSVVTMEFRVATPLNTPPVALDGAYTTSRATPLAETLASLAFDLDRDVLSFSILAGPGNGTLTLNEVTGQWTYISAADFTGEDSFVYIADDGDVAAAGRIVITVENLNAPPVAVDESVQTPRDTPIEVDVLANDSEPDGGVLTLLIAQAPVGGNAVVTANNTILFTPAPGFDGISQIIYRVSDPGGAVDFATLTVTVVAPPNRPPVADDRQETIDEDTSLTGNVLATASDPDGDALGARITLLPENGTLDFEEDTGNFVYVPKPDFNGTDSFRFAVRDGDGLEDEATVAITIAAVPDAPLAQSDQATTPENTPISGNVLGNDRDADGDALTARLAPGTETDVALGTLSFAADGTWSFIPKPDLFGTVQFTYLASDGMTEVPATLTIVVQSVNEAPFARDDVATTDEDTPVSGNVLANDSDGDGDPLTVALAPGVDPVSALGTLALAGDGTWLFTPAAHAHGTFTYAYVLRDGEAEAAATLTILVNPVNDAPSAADGSVTTDEDVAVSGNLLALLGASDVDGDALTVTAIGTASLGVFAIDAASGDFTFQPTPDANGTGGVAVTVSDGSATVTRTLTVAVGPVNDAPLALADSYATRAGTPLVIGAAAGVLRNDSDADADALTAVLRGGVIGGSVTLAEDGGFTFIPDAGFVGEGRFSYVARDGAAESAETVVIVAVQAEEAGPPVAQDDAFAGDEDGTIAGSVLDNDRGGPGTTLSALLVAGPLAGSLMLADDGRFTYRPNADAFGTDSFTYRVSDGALLSEVATVTLTIRPVNDAPTANDGSFSTDEDVEFSGNLLELLGASDVDGDPLSISAVTTTGLGTFAFNAASGHFTFTPFADGHGDGSVAVTVTDGTAAITRTLAFTVRPVDDEAPPPALTPSFSFSQGGTGAPRGSDQAPPVTAPALVAAHVSTAPVTLDGKAFATVENTGFWNQIKNVALDGSSLLPAQATDAQGRPQASLPHDWLIANFVDARADLSTATDDLDVRLVGIKRFDLETGSGDDAVTWVAHSNERTWRSSGVVETGDGDDAIVATSVRLSALDNALLSDNPNPANNRFFWNAGYDGRLSMLIVDAGEGNDRITAQDRVVLEAWGGAGDDIIIGALGNDVIVGGDGNDAVTGGGGADRFRFDDADGSDTIIDFSAPQGDKIQLSSGGSYTLIGTSFTYGTTTVTADNGHLWTAADFLFV